MDLDPLYSAVVTCGGNHYPHSGALFPEQGGECLVGGTEMTPAMTRTF